MCYAIDFPYPLLQPIKTNRVLYRDFVSRSQKCQTVMVLCKLQYTGKPISDNMQFIVLKAFQAKVIMLLLMNGFNYIVELLMRYWYLEDFDFCCFASLLCNSKVVDRIMKG